MTADKSMQEECVREIYFNRSIMASSIDVPLSKLYLFFISSKNQGLACIHSINVGSKFWFPVFFLSQIQNMKKSPYVLLFLSGLCAYLWVGPQEMRFIRSTETTAKSLSPGAGVGRLSIQLSCSLVCKTEE